MENEINREIKPNYSPFLVRNCDKKSKWMRVTRYDVKSRTEQYYLATL